MADLYPTYGRQYQRPDSNGHSHFQLQGPSSNTAGVMYPPQLVTQGNASAPAPPSSSSPQDHEEPSPTQNDTESNSPSSQTASSPKQDSPTGSKQDGVPPQPTKPQATFLTKLYALLERPENHHMIRWDPAGEHIIVERPEQLALHVLPSVYRQSRFASFSRQLNIYGFMRKVNLRNVDPAIDDPDASTWSHPTLNRHSPPEVVANFKRRVPPRLPKPRKRDNNVDVPVIPPPRSAVGMNPHSLGVPSGPGSPGRRARGFSAPGSFTPLTQSTAAGWGTSYPRAALPPLTVPSDPHPSSLSAHSHNGMYSHHYPLTPADDPPSSNTAYTPLSSYSSGASAGNGRDMLLPSPSSAYSHSEQSSWGFSNGGSNAHSSGSLSSLLNPNTSGGAGGYGSRPPTSINSYPSSYGSLPRSAHAGGTSPDSRPATGYSVSSMSSISTPYDDTGAHPFEYSRPNSSHRPLTPASSRPPSSKASAYNPGSLSVRRDRRHSHAMSPYPSPYTEHPPHSAHSERPSTSPHPGDDHSAIPRVRSMMGMSSVSDTYGFNPAQADFAYGAVDDHHSSAHHTQSSHGIYGRSVRPSTSASSLSGSSSTANTPGADGYGQAGEGADINRFSPDFGFVQMNEHIPQYSKHGDL
ncbi:HSF-type DNA-binding-domain-containing protein [Phanerochaete sordida]|uniref:HSF-type DNA-binding-domain-containing protein n=1 Tax=Phanerochaete sordida TaxID=48140 RepID=A0A9P3L8G0_9APHY|nr:HSF-type DNA-binding-domain-containing protein [Phanerochaete sordida]